MASPKITLYIFPGSSSVLPQILLHYTKTAYTPIAIPIKEVSTGFAEINPKGQVPVLGVDDELITEIPAISHAINHLAPDANIMGRTPMDFVRVCEWMNFLSASVHAQVWSVWVRPFRFTDEPDAEAGVKRHAFKKLHDRFALIESKLPASGWTVGDGFTVTDAYLSLFYRWAERRAGMAVETAYPKLASLVERFEAMDAVKEAFAEEARAAKEMAA